jgi:hypothetical protein
VQEAVHYLGKHMVRGMVRGVVKTLLVLATGRS